MRNFLTSFVGHVALLALMVVGPAHCAGGSGKSPKPGEQAMPRGNQDAFNGFEPKDNTVEVALVDSPKGDGPGKPKKASCKYTYSGVGLAESAYYKVDREMVITTVTDIAPGYAADRAGIKVGDELIRPRTEDLRGPEGTPVDITVRRDGALLTFHVIRETICFEPGEDKHDGQNQGRP